MSDPIDTDALRADHVETRGHICRCGDWWPCDVLALLDEIDRLRADLAAELTASGYHVIPEGVIVIPAGHSSAGKRWRFEGWGSGTLHGDALARMALIDTEDK